MSLGQVGLIRITSYNVCYTKLLRVFATCRRLLGIRKKPQPIVAPTACSIGSGKLDKAVSNVRKTSAFTGKDLPDVGDVSLFVSVVTPLAFG